ncbi:MAG TPA: sigma-70 family RNA polymerase sigma factor [Acidimicrobiales bacterium]|nr:sigma-70 family RNA polymerase sigma factor [Acidimicrobiales bacterium]
MTQGAADAASDDPGVALLALYPEALPCVYGYVLARCGRQSIAEEVTSDTLLAAVDTVRRPGANPVTIPWLIGVARHKLVDHWRRQAREERHLEAVAAAPRPADPWDAELDVLIAQATLLLLSSDHRAVLTLRYMDDLPVGKVAELMQRSVHATEGLLSRAKAAFRAAYETEVDHG